MNKHFIFLGFMFSLMANAGEPIKFETVAGTAGSGQMWVAATFDGVTERCILDSGARISAVNDRPIFAAYPKIGSDFTTGVTGNVVPVDLIRINETQVGDLSIQNHTIRRQPDFVLSCLIGNDLLQTKSLYYDFVKNEILTNVYPAKEQSRPLHRYNGKWIGFPLTIAGGEYESFWDTGAGFTVVDSEIVDAHSEEFTFIQEIPMGDGTGEHGTAKIYSMKSLQFGQFEVRDSVVISYSLAQIRKEVPNIKAILGHNVLTQFNWYIDNLNGKWSAEKIAK